MVAKFYFFRAVGNPPSHKAKISPFFNGKTEVLAEFLNLKELKILVKKFPV